MNPLPKDDHPKAPTKEGAMPALPTLLAPSPAGSYSSANRRVATCGAQKLYPVLLCASTVVAGAFCLLYITKPVILAASNPTAIPPISKNYPLISESPQTTGTTAEATSPTLLPSPHRLPGESHSESAEVPPAAPDARSLPSRTTLSKNDFEETNLRIQHILTAESPGGSLARIDIEVPVLYQSRNLRWTAEEVDQARALLARLQDYQEKSSLLRSEGAGLLTAWNHLIERSIPSSDLRADSPTLPVNQQDAADSPRSGSFSTSDSIKIQPTGK